MRRFLISIVSVASLAIAVAGCKQNSSNNSDGTMKMSTAMPCCGDSCEKMGADCCKKDDKGNVACSMGGSCCVKTDGMKM